MCKILVIDDERDVREFLCEELASFGHEVVGAANGGDALNWLSAQQPDHPCLLVLDLLMPIMDGWDFLKSLRVHKDWAKLPVIVLSATLKRGSYPPVLPAQAFWQKPPPAEKFHNIHRYCALHRDPGSASPGPQREKVS
jgi:CheY-like chemotaxis protein